MVDAKPRDEVRDINDQLLERGWKARLALVSVDKIDLLERNARFMRNETFRNLVSNIQRDGELESVPLCLFRDGRYLCLSGNHRVMAAKQAGLKDILVMYRDDELTEEELVAKQLSHNAIVGEDDPVILKELWEKIRSIDLKLYSGLDDKRIGEMVATAMKSLSEARLDFRAVTFLFLPEEIEKLEETFKTALEQAPGRDVFLARFEEFDRMLDAMAAAQIKHNVRNTAVALMIVLSAFDGEAAVEMRHNVENHA